MTKFNCSTSNTSVFIDLPTGRNNIFECHEDTTSNTQRTYILSNDADIFITANPTNVIELDHAGDETNAFPIPTHDGGIIIASQGDNYEIYTEKYDISDSRFLPRRRQNNIQATEREDDPKGLELQDNRIILSWLSGRATNTLVKILNPDLSTNISESPLTAVGASLHNYVSPPILLNNGTILFLLEVFQQDSYVINGVTWNINSQIKNDLTISSSNLGDLRAPDPAALPDGGFVAVYYGYTPNNVFLNIMIDVFDNNFLKITSKSITSDTTGQKTPFNGNQKNARVEVNNDKIGIIWECVIQNGKGVEICLASCNLDLINCQIITPLNIYTENHQLQPDLTSLPGKFKTTWKSIGQAGGFRYVTVESTIDINSYEISNEALVNTDISLTGNAITPSIESSADGDSFICYERNNNIKYRRYPATITVFAEGGDDLILLNGIGNYIDCGPGVDTVSVNRSSVFCVANFLENQACGDQIFNCENFVCSDAGCTVTTNGGNVVGGSGSDVVIATLPIVFEGGGGDDEISFALSKSSITYDSTTGTGSDGVNSVEAYNVKTIRGSDHGDIFTVTSDDKIFGGAGDDTFVISPSFTSAIDIKGGAGVNKISLALITTAATADFTTGTITIGGNSISFSNIQILILSSPNGNTIVGSLSEEIKLSYEAATEGIICNLNLKIGTCSLQMGKSDNIENINYLLGSPFADILEGTGISTLLGSGGDDEYIIKGDDEITDYQGSNTAKIENDEGTVSIYSNSTIIDFTRFEVYTISDLDMKSIGEDVRIYLQDEKKSVIAKDKILANLTNEDFIFSTLAETSSDSSSSEDGWSTLTKVGIAFTFSVSALTAAWRFTQARTEKEWFWREGGCLNKKQDHIDPLELQDIENIGDIPTEPAES